MNENEFRAAYADSQKHVALTEDRKRAIAAAAKHRPNESAASSGNARGTNAARCGSASEADTARPSVKQRRPLAKLALPIAACLAVIALAVGIATAGGGGGPFGFPNATPDFAVQAYAADSDSLLEMGTENQIIFSRDININGIGDREDYRSEGYYTDCLFRVEGDGITRIQASVSTGVIYRYEKESITIGENPERWYELMSWKPSARGLGEYFGGYDNVNVAGSNDSLPKDDPDKQWTVGLTKKLGSTIDVPVDGSSGCSFGFWTNEDYGSVDGMEAIDAVIDLFDGAELTITATFDDGHTTTQVIKLHAADIRASMVQNDDGLWELALTPEIVDAEAEGLESFTDYIHTLYGTVEKTTHEPFPGSLENANELENVVSEPMTFERQDLLRPLEGDAAITEKDIRPATDTVPFTRDLGTSFSLTNVQMLSRSTQMPDGITLDDLRTGMQSWDYFNRVVSQIDGYSLDENGTPTEGFSWVLMEADVANTGDKATELTGDGGYYGEFAVRDGEARVSTALARTFALVNGGWDATAPAKYGDFTLAPGESTTVRWLAIVPDVVLDDPSLFFLTCAVYSDNYADAENVELNGIELPLPSE